VTLPDLRTIKELQGLVDAKIRTLPLELAHDQQGADSVRGRKPVSGRAAKAEYNVQKEIKWPHSVLEFQFTGKSVAYDDLDFSLLVAGEVSIVLDSTTSPTERIGRLNLLKHLAYYNRKRDWQEITNLHASFLAQVESNKREWSDTDLSELKSTVFLSGNNCGDSKSRVSTGQNTGYKFKKGPGPVKKARFANSGTAYSPRSDRSFCSDFNQGQCPHDKAHEGILGDGHYHMLEHICATCLLDYNEVQRHAETRGCSRYDPTKVRKLSLRQQNGV
jgi:hypothetical protein